MNKYIYSECTQEDWPEIHSLMAVSYNDAVEKLIQKYVNEFEDDNIEKFDNIKTLQEYLNETYSFVISDLEDVEEL